MTGCPEVTAWRARRSNASAINRRPNACSSAVPSGAQPAPAGRARVRTGRRAPRPADRSRVRYRRSLGHLHCKTCSGVEPLVEGAAGWVRHARSTRVRTDTVDAPPSTRFPGVIAGGSPRQSASDQAVRTSGDTRSCRDHADTDTSAAAPSGSHRSRANTSIPRALSSAQRAYGSSRPGSERHGRNPRVACCTSRERLAAGRAVAVRAW
jgi:hypothetical protein